MFPPFHWWLYLIPVALLAYFIIQAREGNLKLLNIISTLFLGLIAFVLSAAMLAVFIIPIVFLLILFTFLSKLRSEDKPSKVIALVVLLLFVGSGITAFSMARAQGPYWKLTRFQAGSPGTAYYRETAKNQVFSKTELLEHLRSEQPQVRQNAEGVILELANLEDDPEEAEAFYCSIKEINAAVANLYQEKAPPLRDLLTNPPK